MTQQEQLPDTLKFHFILGGHDKQSTGEPTWLERTLFDTFLPGTSPAGSKYAEAANRLVHAGWAIEVSLFDPRGHLNTRRLYAQDATYTVVRMVHVSSGWSYEHRGGADCTATLHKAIEIALNACPNKDGQPALTGEILTGAA